MKAEISGASQNIQVKVVNYLNQRQSFLLSLFRLVVKNNLWLKGGKAGDEDHDLALQILHKGDLFLCACTAHGACGHGAI